MCAVTTALVFVLTWCGNRQTSDKLSCSDNKTMSFVCLPLFYHAVVHNFLHGFSVLHLVYLVVRAIQYVDRVVCWAHEGSFRINTCGRFDFFEIIRYRYHTPPPTPTPSLHSTCTKFRSKNIPLAIDGFKKTAISPFVDFHTGYGALVSDLPKYAKTLTNSPKIPAVNSVQVTARAVGGSGGDGTACAGKWLAVMAKMTSFAKRHCLSVVLWLKCCTKRALETDEHNVQWYGSL